jgi:hypothetical protein
MATVPPACIGLSFPYQVDSFPLSGESLTLSLDMLYRGWSLTQEGGLRIVRSLPTAVTGPPQQRYPR